MSKKLENLSCAFSDIDLSLYNYIFITPQKNAKFIFEIYFSNKNLISNIYVPAYEYVNDIKTIVWKDINYG